MKYLIILSLLIAGCAPTEDDLIGKAQLCLDHAHPSEAQNCIEPIRGYDKASAQLVKCSAGFASEDFGRGLRLAKAYGKLDQKGQGMVAFLAAMTFYTHHTPEQNREFARQTNQYCQGSKISAYQLLGALSLTATTIAATGGLQWSSGNPPTRDQIIDAMNALKATRNDPETIQALQEVGSAIVIMLERSCEKKSVGDDKLCAQAQAAVAGGGEKGGESIGERALDVWQSE